MPDMNCRVKRVGLRGAFLWGILGLIMLLPATVWAGGHTVMVQPPNGADDTANIQAALNACVAFGKNCTVQLAAGTYLTRQLVAYKFQGTFKGMGKDITVIQALPYLPVTLDFLQPCQPNTTTCLWPTLMIFVDSGISISDLSVHMIATDGTATAPWPGSGGGATYIETGIRLMGQYSTTNVHIDRIEEEGRPDSTSGFGFNVNNGIMYTGELSGSSANPLDSPCGAAGGFYFVSGSYTVRNSSFKSMGDGVSQDGCVRSTRVTIGGSPSTGNSYENHFVGIDLESAEDSNFEISYNVSSGTAYSMWVVPWIPSVFVPSKSSRYLIHDNTFFTTDPYATGVLLYNDDPNHSWIDAVIWNNSIQLQNTLSDGIDAVNTKGTTILNNSVTGSGYDAIGLWGSTSSTVIHNNVSDFTPDAIFGNAQIFLDPGTSHDLVVCAEPSNTVLNQGTNNVVIGCQQLDAASKSVSPADSKPRQGLPKGKPWLRHP
jgi:parallel beta-helix repeat protein